MSIFSSGKFSTDFYYTYDAGNAKREQKIIFLSFCLQWIELIGLNLDTILFKICKFCLVSRNEKRGFFKMGGIDDRVSIGKVYLEAKQI